MAVVAVEGENFLADADGAAIHHLNAVGSAIWNLLVEPTTIDDTVKLLLVAFPQIGRDQIKNDVDSLISSLMSKNLLITSSNHKVVGRELAGLK